MSQASGASTDSTAATSLPSSAATVLSPHPFSVREVYKAGWLRRSGNSDRSGPFGRKHDRLWALFCIHDDIQPYLEFYTDPKSSSAHQPLWAATLSHCLHVSPSITVQGDGSFEFVIVSSTSSAAGSLRLGAGSREQMNEWVDVLRNRLRDIGVIEPKENLYSPMPEGTNKHSSRDPNSPLPLPPPQVVSIPPTPITDPVSSQIVTTSSEEHVTVIAIDDQFRPAHHATRVRIASAPSSMQEALVGLEPLTAEDLGVEADDDDDQENSYETIFSPATTPPTPPSTTTIPSSSNQPSQRLTIVEHPPVVRTTSSRPIHFHHQRSREGLRRTVSVGPAEQQQQPRSLPILLPTGRILLPPPPLPPPPLTNSPLFRPLIAASPPALQSVSVNHHNHVGGPSADGGYSLKERQVQRLRMEIQHPAGVRIVLKKKDCLNTIALIDALGTVWVGGWRQKEKPLLYNVFHIGDQIVRVGHCNVSSSADIQRLLKTDGSAQIEFIVRRVPFGRVFHLRREADGQPVGMITDLGSEVREVVAGGLAAQQGVPPMAISPLSMEACTWTLTEINGRPLNLCSREGEARDRLAAVGRAVTILLQPTDFVTKVIKKGLKGLRGYKEFLLG